jgi:hypothetical protein
MSMLTKSTGCPARGHLNLTLIVVALAGCASPPPAPAGKSVALVNPGFESTNPGRRNDPEGFFSFQHAGEPSYRYALDTSEPRSGARALRIDNIGPEPYGAIAQAVDARGQGGKVARYTAWLRTRDAAGASLTILAQQNGAYLANDTVAVKGTTPWTRHTLVLPIPPGADRIEIGAMLQGKGSLWLDDVELTFGDK